jgi:D-beta-D-heptose 7-phosphate kinase / D-beta-D-heptose 1-phosphate adenosyltransferase
LQTKRSLTLENFLLNAKSKNESIVFTNGCFDLVHSGHLEYLKHSKTKGDRLLIALNSDTSVKRLKGEARPIKTQIERKQFLEALDFVDFVTIFEEDTPQTLIELVRPDVITKGGDYEEKDIVGGEFIKSYGGKVSVLPFKSNLSSTNIIERIKKL